MGFTRRLRIAEEQRRQNAARQLSGSVSTSQLDEAVHHPEKELSQKTILSIIADKFRQLCSSCSCSQDCSCAKCCKEEPDSPTVIVRQFQAARSDDALSSRVSIVDSTPSQEQPLLAGQDKHSKYGSNDGV